MSDEGLDLVGKVRLDTAELDGLAGRVRGVFGSIAGIAAGAFAGVEIFGFLKDSVADAREAAKATRETADVVEHMGNAANISAPQVASLAEHISNLTGIQHDAVQAGENMLLTFGNVQNRVGAGNDIFNQASSVVADFSARFGLDLSHSAVLVGKALNDPITGMTALRRVGVTLTDQQKEQVKQFMKVGDIASAQKVILSELGREAGGAAAAAADPWQLFQNQLHNFMEDVGTKLLPILSQFVPILAEVLPPALALISALLTTLIPVLTPIVDAFARFVQNDPTPIFAALGVLLGGALLAGLIGILSPIVLVVAGIAALVAGVVYAYEHFQAFRDIVDTVLKFLTGQFDHFIAFAKVIWPQLEEVVTHVVNVIRAVWDEFGPYILEAAKVVWTMIHGVISAAVKLIENVIRLTLAIINGDWGQAWDALKGIVSAVWDGIFAVVKGAIGILLALVKGIGHGIELAADGIFDGLKWAFKAALNWIIDQWNSMAKSLSVDIPLPGVPKISIPTIPHLATGGTAVRPGLALVGENGPEYLSLPQGASVIPLDHTAGSITIGDIHLHGVTDGASVRDAIPDLIDALRAGVGSRGGT